MTSTPIRPASRSRTMDQASRMRDDGRGDRPGDHRQLVVPGPCGDEPDGQPDDREGQQARPRMAPARRIAVIALESRARPAPADSARWPVSGYHPGTAPGPRSGAHRRVMEVS